MFTIQDTEVIDATGSGASDSVGTSAASGASESVGATRDSGASESVGTSDAGVPVEPIPPVTDPADDPVVRAAGDEAADQGGVDDPVLRSADEHDGDRLNDPRT